MKPEQQQQPNPVELCIFSILFFGFLFFLAFQAYQRTPKESYTPQSMIPFAPHAEEIFKQCKWYPFTDHYYWQCIQNANNFLDCIRSASGLTKTIDHRLFSCKEYALEIYKQLQDADFEHREHIHQSSVFFRRFYRRITLSRRDGFPFVYLEDQCSQWG